MNASLLYIGLFLIFLIYFCESQTQDASLKAISKDSGNYRIRNIFRNNRKPRATSNIRRIQRRLDIVEVRQNAEMQYRKEDTEHMYQKISEIEKIMNTTRISIEHDENENEVSTLLHNTDEVIRIEDYRSLKKGFADEKRLNSNLREEVRQMENDIEKCSVDKTATEEGFTNISKQIKDMKIYTESTTSVLADEKRLNSNLREQVRKMENDIEKCSVDKTATEEGFTNISKQIKDMKIYAELTTSVHEENRRLSEDLKHVKDSLFQQQEVLDMVLLKLNTSSNQVMPIKHKNNKETNKGSENTHKETKQHTELNPGEVYASSCQNLYKQGYRTSGIYKIDPANSESPFLVYCDHDIDGGGWTVFQRRIDGSVDFNRTWLEYKNGFGDLRGEFWLGNKYLHQMTYSGVHELRIELCDWTNTTKYAKYSRFNISPESRMYTLRVSGHSGTVDDSFADYHSGRMFSTFDKNSCAKRLGGGWWFKTCSKSNLNGNYITSTDGRHHDPSRGIHWFSWGKYSYSMKFTEMKFR